MTIASQSTQIHKETSSPLRLMVWISPPILSSPASFVLSQIRLTRHPPHLHALLATPQLSSWTLFLLFQKGYNSDFLCLKTISLKQHKNFLLLIQFYLMIDPFFHAPVTSNSSCITPFLDVNITESTIPTAHEEQKDHAPINICNIA